MIREEGLIREEGMIILIRAGYDLGGGLNRGGGYHKGGREEGLIWEEGYDKGRGYDKAIIIWHCNYRCCGDGSSFACFFFLPCLYKRCKHQSCVVKCLEQRTTENVAKIRTNSHH